MVLKNLLTLLLATAAGAQKVPTLHLHVTDENLRPLPSAFLSFVAPGTPGFRDPGTRRDSDATGTIRIPMRNAPSLRPWALLIAPGRAWVKLDIQRSLAGNTRLRPFDPADRHLSVRLPAGGEIRGILRAPRGHRVTEAIITATDILRTANLADPPPVHFASSTSTRKASFRLQGIPNRGVAIEVRAPGFQRKKIRYARPKHPLVVNLTPAHTLSGQLTDARGFPVTATGEVFFIESHDRQPIRAGSDGRFTTELLYPGPYEVSFTTIAADLRSPIVRTSSRQNGTVKDLEIAFQRRVFRSSGFHVNARDARGAPIRTFRAIADWSLRSRGPFARGFMERQLMQNGTTATDGRILFAVPDSFPFDTGQLLVRAAGFAPAFVDISHVRQQTVTLRPEAKITGAVLNAETGRGLAGVLVTASDSPLRMGSPSRATRTDAKGRFELDQLSHSPHQLTARLPGRRVLTRKAVASPTQGLQLKMRRGFTLTAVVKNAVPGMQIGLPPTLPWQALDDQGTAVLRGLSAAKLNLRARVPGRAPDAFPYEVPLAPLQIEADTRYEFDPIDKLRGIVRGRIRFAGAAVPPDRLLVQARAVPNHLLGKLRVKTGRFSQSQHAAVDAKGEFVLEADPDIRQLRVFDLATGIQLNGNLPTVDVAPSAVVTTRIKLRLALLRIELIDRRKTTAGAPLEYQLVPADTTSPRWLPIVDPADLEAIFAPAVRLHLRVRARVDRSRFRKPTYSSTTKGPKIDRLLGETTFLPNPERSTPVRVTLADPKPIEKPVREAPKLPDRFRRR